jgi:hypothetical protein
MNISLSAERAERKNYRLNYKAFLFVSGNISDESKSTAPYYSAAFS